MAGAALPVISSPRSVTRVLEAVARGLRTPRALQEIAGLDPEHAADALSAAAFLGLVEVEGEPQLTATGLEVVYGDRSRSFSRAVLAQPLVMRALDGRRAAPDLARWRSVVAEVEPALDDDAIQTRAAALKGLVGAALRTRDADAGSEPRRQLGLPFAERTVTVSPPRLDAVSTRDYNPDLYRWLYGALLDHGELTLGQIRALLDRANAVEAPLGGYVDLALHRGDAARVDDRIVASLPGLHRRALSESTPSIILSDPGYRAWLDDLRLAAKGDRAAEIRRERVRGRYRAWDRRIFGRDADPARLDGDLHGLLVDRSIDAFPLATGGPAPERVSEPFLDVWERAGLAIALPPSLAAAGAGLGPINQSLRMAREGRLEVAVPDLAYRPSIFHGGPLHPGEPLPRAVPDQRTLRLRLLAHAPFVACAAAILLLHRSGAPIEVRWVGGRPMVFRDEAIGDLLEVIEAFGASRGWAVARRRANPLSAPRFAEMLEQASIAVSVGGRLVLAERLFAQLRGSAEEQEVYARLRPLAEGIEASVVSPA